MSAMTPDRPYVSAAVHDAGDDGVGGLASLSDLILAKMAFRHHTRRRETRWRQRSLATIGGTGSLKQNKDMLSIWRFKAGSQYFTT
jgi:hypothetical protein